MYSKSHLIESPYEDLLLCKNAHCEQYRQHRVVFELSVMRITEDMTYIREGPRGEDDDEYNS